MTDTTVLVNYTDAIANLPEEAYLGSLLYFSICAADVNLDKAREDLINAGLSTDGLRKNLRPVDAFRKASKKFEKKFKPANGIRSELMTVRVGTETDQSYLQLVLERAVVRAGEKRRVFYEKVGELTFTRGMKKDGEYVDHGVESRRTTGNLPTQLTTEEDAWLTERLDSFHDDYDHLLHFMDSHAVRTFVRESIYNLSGTCVKETGGLYFVRQRHVPDVHLLQNWVQSVGSEFYSIPLLNAAENPSIIAKAFEEEAIEQIARLEDEVANILNNPERTIEEKTFDAYAEQASALKDKIQEYHAMLGTRADEAQGHLDIYGQQIMKLMTRIRQPKTHS